MRTWNDTLKLAWLALFVASLCGCQHDPYADWFLKGSVSESTVIGRYRVTNETLNHFASVHLPFITGGRLPITTEATILIGSDHKVFVNEIPIDLGGKSVCMFTAPGTWKLIKHQEFAAVGVVLKDARPAGAGCPQGEFGLDLDLFDDSARHLRSSRKYPLLHLTIGDPDSGDALQFEKY